MKYGYNMTILGQKLLEDALDLPTNKRMQLIDKLLQNTNIQPQSDIDQAWAMEVERRDKEVQNGSVELIPGEEVVKKVNLKFLK